MWPPRLSLRARRRSAFPSTGWLRHPAEAAHRHVLDAVEGRVDLAESVADGADVLADVVAVAAALDHVEQLVVTHHLAGTLVQRGQDALRRQRQVDAPAPPGRRALPQRVERQL